MTNEQMDDIITPENNDDVELDLGVDSNEDSNENLAQGDKRPQKQPEAPEARLARLKRQTAQLEKKLGLNTESKSEFKKQDKPDDSGLLEKAFLRSAAIITEDEVELALSTAKKWNMTVDKLVDDEDFQLKLERFRTQKANELATSNIKGGKGTSQAKNTPEYWIAKGMPPSTADVPDRKTRAKIARAMMQDAKSSKTFYNE